MVTAGQGSHECDPRITREGKAGLVSGLRAQRLMHAWLASGSDAPEFGELNEVLAEVRDCPDGQCSEKLLMVLSGAAAGALRAQFGANALMGSEIAIGDYQTKIRLGEI